jgi:GNAT superfamily N-acetyltransferase
VPVHLEWVKRPTQQDLTDLQKLLDDAPPEWQLQGMALQSYLTSQPLLAAGRFNDRLIALAEISEQQSAYKIERVLVRKVTRNRGVAHQLLTRLCQWADTERHDLRIQCAEGQSLLEYGFFASEPDWLRKPAGPAPV